MKKFTIFMWLILIIGILLTGWFYEGTLPINSTDKSTKIIAVPKGSSVNSIINILSDENLIRNRVVFLLIIKQMKIENKIQAGDFRLSPSMSAYEIADNLTKGSLDIWVRIIEGERKEEIAQKLSKDFSIPEIQFIEKAQEGTLFPDTYLIPRQASADDVLAILDKNFKLKYNEELRAQARQKGLSDLEVLTLASLVEREARSYENKVKVASIILKRLNKGWPLQIDATVQYAIGYQENEKTWWKRHLSARDLQIASLYNTYKNPGLPPGPICNPGLDSIKAVINADISTPYWFYISNKDGSKMLYSKTVEEHNKNIELHLR